MKTIEIKDYQKGVGQSPYVGYGAIRSLDVFKTQGIAKKEISPTPKFDSSSVLSADNFGLRYFVDTAGFYLADNSNIFDGNFANLTGGETFNPNGLVIWKNYLITFANSLHCYGPLDGTPIWNDISVTSDEQFDIKPLHFIDDSLYFACGGFGGVPRLLRLSEDGTFDPTDSATYTKEENVLEIPSGYTIKTLVQYGGKIMIGAEDTDGNAIIFPWDGYSDEFNLPIYINEKGLHSIEVAEGRMYILAGEKGNWYISDGTQTQLYKEMPDIWEKTNFLPNITSNCTSLKGNIIYFGISNTWADYSTTPNTYGVEKASGVWGLNLKTGALTQVYSAESLIGETSLDFDETALLYITGLLNGVENIGIAFQDNTDFNWNVQLFKGRSDGSFVDDETAYIETPFYQIGKIYDKEYPFLEFYLGNPLSTGENIKVYYRKNIDDDWTLHQTLSGTFLQTKKIAEVVTIQFKIVLNTDSELTNIYLNYGK